MAKRNKNWQITKISRDLEEFKLLDAWKKYCIKEAKLRKDCMKSVSSFKTWYLTLLKAMECDDKIDIIEDEYNNLENKTDVQKDWIQERGRIQASFEGVFKGLPAVWDLFIKNEKKVRQFLKNPELVKYKTKIELDYLSGANHRLSDQNKLITKEIGGIDALKTIYENLSSDLISDRVYDAQGREYRDVSWRQLGNQKDPKVRRDTFVSYYSSILKHRHTLGAIMFYTTMRKHQDALMRNFKNDVDSIADVYGIKLQDYWYIIDQCSKFAPLNVKYRLQNQKIIKNAFGLKEFEPWDTDIEIKDIYQELPSTDACENLALESLNSMGEEYCNHVKEIYKKGIIRWNGSENNEKNGYCLSGLNTLDENPIEVKWNGKATGALTLSHEVGHNLKNLYGKLNNEVNNKVELIFAETASIVNEFISCFYLIDKYRKEKNANYLYGMYKSLFTYYFYSVCDHGLTLQFHDSFVMQYVKQKDINSSLIEEIYIKNKRQFYGMTKAEFNKAWNKHPYYYEKLEGYRRYISFAQKPRNIIAYYIGAIIGLPIAYKIYHGDKDMLNKYLKFLKTGNSTKPLNATKVLGIDLLKPQIYTESKQIMNKILNQFINEIKVK